MHALPQIVLLALPLGLALLGCAQTPNQYAADSPSLVEPLDSPTAVEVRADYAPADQRVRDWPARRTAAEPTAVIHGPLYAEDPFEDKGATYRHRLGWEDWAAFAYCPTRFSLNLLAMPVSAVVTPPWTIMESDGELSRQALGYDHDAQPAPEHPLANRHTEPVEISGNPTAGPASQPAQ